MSQSTLGDDNLFGEAAAKMHVDVEEHLGEARSTLPNPDDMWEADIDDVLDVLSDLYSSLDVEDTVECV